MTCRPVSHPGVLRKARPGGGRPPLPRPPVDPGPGPGSGPLTRCRPRCGCISGPGSGWQGDSACAPWRAPWRSACSRKGWSRSTCPSAAWCLRATITCVRAGRPAGLGVPRQVGWGQDARACSLPSAGLAQSLYCWGLHTGVLPGEGTASGRPARPRPRPTRPFLGSPAPYQAYASFGSRTSEPRISSRRPGDTPLDCRERWGLGWGWGDPGDQRILAQSQDPEMMSCSRPRAVAGSSAIEGPVKKAPSERMGRPERM